MSQIKITGSQFGKVHVGEKCSIGSNVEIIFVGEGIVEIGDYVTISDNVKMVIESGQVSIGEWSTLHPSTIVFCKNGVNIGAHCWFGQNTVIDGTGGLVIENGVRVGMFSQLWTHVAAGEQIEGCMLYGETPSHIETDVWLVGTCTMGSGVRIGRRTIALAGSNITKNCPPNVVLAGAPAKIKEGLSFYREVSLHEKFDMLKNWVSHAPIVLRGEAYVETSKDMIIFSFDNHLVHFYKTEADFEKARNHSLKSLTLCCIENKRYIKTFNDAERVIFKYLSGNKARFYSI